jgi:enoyl-CoA hydratase
MFCRTLTRRLSSSSAAAAGVVTTAIRGRVAILTLSDEARLNPMTEKLGDSFGKAFASLDYRTVCAVVLTGAGRAFSAGGDLDFLRARAAATQSENFTTMLRFYRLFLTPLRSCPVPTIASIHGPAVGAGACLATACDMRLVSSAAKVGFTFAGLGIHAGMAGSFYLPKAIGPGAAARLLLGGEIISGERAAQLGWAELVEGDALTASVAAGERIAAGAPQAVRGMTRTLRSAADVGLDAALEREAAAQAQAYAGADFRTGVEAVASKTRPVWTEF